MGYFYSRNNSNAHVAVDGCDELTDNMNCKEGTQNIICQIQELLELIDQDTFTKPLDIYHGSTIGQHFRHLIEFYSCLVKGLGVGLVDYSDRDRDPLVETLPSHAAGILNQLGESLARHEEGMALAVLTEFTADSREKRQVVSSSFGRELMFAHDHAIHHLAIVKIGLAAALPGLELQHHFGVAPSTIKHRERQAAAGIPGGKIQH